MFGKKKRRTEAEEKKKPDHEKRTRLAIGCCHGEAITIWPVWPTHRGARAVRYGFCPLLGTVSIGSDV